MTKKDFGASLRKTASTQEQVIADRFAIADSTLLSGKATVPVNKPTEKAKPVMLPAEPTKDTTLVTRDTFSMPASDYALIEQLRVRAAREGRNTTKSEVVRAGLQGLMALSSAQLLAILNGLEKVKPGRK
jgi:hypothetical protein